jgi:biotin synthase
MNTSDLANILNRVYLADKPDVKDIEFLLDLEDSAHCQILYDYADNVRKRYVGDGILLRGIVEFSNHCRNNCLYCGLNNKNQNIQRYRLSQQEIINCVEQMSSGGIKTVVMQSGEEDDLDPVWLKELIEQIKTKFDIAVTLSVGQRDISDYRSWRNAGADRFLLKIESSNEKLYSSLHPEMNFNERVECSRQLRSLGYQTGSGCIVGLRGQTTEILARDILFFSEENFDMIGIGPFIPHHATELAADATGNVSMVLKMIAVTRIVTKNTHLPATTALGSIGEGDMRLDALKAGANVLMPNYTPIEYKKLYEIYPGKRCVDEPSGACTGCMESMARAIGRNIDYSRGDSLKQKPAITTAFIG